MSSDQDAHDNEIEKSTPVAEQAEAEKQQLPPEAQGEMNGGPLGCCLGVTIGLVFSVSIVLISRLFGEQLFQLLGPSWTATLIRILMGLVALAAVIICGRLGWRIGIAIFKEYPKPQIPPRKTRRKRKVPSN